jgi:hypothetical protein
MSDNVYQPYPAWRFHPDHPARLVQNAEEDQALEKGWLDSHLKLPTATPVEPAPPPAPAAEDHTATTTGPEPETSAPKRSRSRARQQGA